MAEQQRRRTRICWLSGILAALGACIALFAAMQQLNAPLVVVAAAVMVTVLMDVALAKTDRLCREMNQIIAGVKIPVWSGCSIVAFGSHFSVRSSKARTH